jgi:anti-sigma-K factor RskA
MNAQEQSLAELAPFYVAGTLKPEERAEFEAALAGDEQLARNVAAARAELEQVIALNEALPAPGARAAGKLFAALDAEPARTPGFWRRLDVGARLGDLLSPRALGWLAAAACLLVAVEAGFLLKPAQGPADYVTASRREAPATAGRFALVAFAPEAGAAEIAGFLARNGAQIVEGPRAGGVFRVRLGGAEMSAAQAEREIEQFRASRLFRFAQKAGGP